MVDPCSVPEPGSRRGLERKISGFISLLGRVAAELQRGLLLTVLKLSVVVPTISGREEDLSRTISAYEDTLVEIEHEIIVIKDNPTWPGACNRGYAQSEGDVVHFGADDLEPLSGWYIDVLDWLEEYDELPAARVFNYSSEGEHDNAEDGGDAEIVWFTRVPIMRRDQWERIGPWPLIYHYADIWISEKARTLGIETRMFFSYSFAHHWSNIGRQGYTPQEMQKLERLRLRM